MGAASRPGASGYNPGVIPLRPILSMVVVLIAAGCQLPVTPWARFTAYSVPYHGQDDFKKRFDAWRTGRGVSWTLTYRASAHSDSALVLRSEGASSFGPRLVGTSDTGGEFTPTRAELALLVDELTTSKIFDLYDGHYGAYDQGGGLRGPEMRIEVGGLLKLLSYDDDLNASTSWEAAALQRASQAVTTLGLRYIRKAGASPAPSAAPSSAPSARPSVGLKSVLLHPGARAGGPATEGGLVDRTP